MAEDWKGWKVGPESMHTDDFNLELIEYPFFLPQRFTARGSKDELRAEIEVEVEGKRIRIRKVTVETDSPRGVSSTTLRRVPVRGIVFNAAAAMLWHQEQDPKTRKMDWVRSPFKWKKRGLPEEAFNAITRAVQYVGAAR